jgi:hypothetical protein
MLEPVNIKRLEAAVTLKKMQDDELGLELDKKLKN